MTKVDRKQHNYGTWQREVEKNEEQRQTKRKKDSSSPGGQSVHKEGGQQQVEDFYWKTLTEKQQGRMQRQELLVKQLEARATAQADETPDWRYRQENAALGRAEGGLERWREGGREEGGLKLKKEKAEKERAACSHADSALQGVIRAVPSISLAHYSSSVASTAAVEADVMEGGNGPVWKT
ncbi:hypothetical protein Q8A73_003823 [Channa argus]|nr:hypothetical protein Q8A73_003823 [Channa argus]